jgi:hypothetical protein
MINVGEICPFPLIVDAISLSLSIRLKSNVIYAVKARQNPFEGEGIREEEENEQHMLESVGMNEMGGNNHLVCVCNPHILLNVCLRRIAREKKCSSSWRSLK